MDKLTQGFSQGSPRQKIIFTILISFGLVLLISFFYFFTNPNAQNSSNENSKEASPTPIASSLTPIQPDSTWITYEGENYELSYPPSLSGVPGVIDGGNGGTTFVLTGKENVGYTIELQITFSHLASMEEIMDFFRSSKFEEEQAIISNLYAKKFSGSMFGYQEGAVIFENKDKIYKFQLTYTADKKNPKIEQVFEGVISTFKLTN